MRNHYDVTTISLRTNSQNKALPVLKDQLATMPGLLACWFTDIGEFNKVMVIRNITDFAANLEERRKVLWARNPFGIGDLITAMTMDTYTAFDFVPQMMATDMGPCYEVRTYVFKTDGVAPTEQLWREWLPKRAKISPNLTAMVSLSGTVARFMHIWPYKTLDERTKIRAKASAEKVWPPPGGPEHFVSMQNDIYLPAPFSPLR